MTDTAAPGHPGRLSERTLECSPARLECGDKAAQVAILEKVSIRNEPVPLKNRFAPVDPRNICSFETELVRKVVVEVKKDYERMLDIVAGAFREFDVVDVTPGDVLKFLNDNFTQHATARRSYKARLSTFFSWCVLERLCRSTRAAG